MPDASYAKCAAPLPTSELGTIRSGSFGYRPYHTSCKLKIAVRELWIGRRKANKKIRWLGFWEYKFDSPPDPQTWHSPNCQTATAYILEPWSPKPNVLQPWDSAFRVPYLLHLITLLSRTHPLDSSLNWNRDSKPKKPTFHYVIDSILHFETAALTSNTSSDPSSCYSTSRPIQCSGTGWIPWLADECSIKRPFETAARPIPRSSTLG